MDDTKNICRICLDTNEKLEASLNDDIVQAKIATIFNFPLDIQASLPSLICEQCLSKIDEFFEFSDRVRNNQEQLKAKNTDCPLVYVKAEPWEEVNHCLTVVPASAGGIHLLAATKEEKCEEGPGVDSEDEDKEEDEEEDGEEEEDDDEEESQSKRPVRERSKDVKKEDCPIKEFYSLKCEFCATELESYQKLRHHTRSAHKKSHVFRCCGKDLKRRHVILNHIALHLSPDHFKCGICNKRYRNKNTLKMHELQVHNATEAQQFKCDQCSQAFPRQHLLKSHLKKHIHVSCDICNKELANSSALRNHKLNMHTEDGQKHVCDVCGKELSCKQNLVKHKLRHSDRKPEDRVPCQMCGKLFSSNENLKAHVKNSHNGESVTCETCSQVYPNLKALRAHKARVHVEDKFECNVCGKRFKRALVLKEHYTMHTGEKLYSCDICGVESNSSANLYVHKKKKHPEVWLEAKKKAYASVPAGGL